MQKSQYLKLKSGTDIRGCASPGEGIACSDEPPKIGYAFAFAGPRASHPGQTDHHGGLRRPGERSAWPNASWLRRGLRRDGLRAVPTAMIWSAALATRTALPW